MSLGLGKIKRSKPQANSETKSKNNMLILGAGYAGLNVYYRIRRRVGVRIIASSDMFVFETARLRSVILNKQNYYVQLPSYIIKETVTDLDIDSRQVITNHGRYEADIIVIALGSIRSGLDKILYTATKSDRPSIASESRYDEYIALQMALYLNSKKKQVSYAGGFMDWLGEEVSKTVRSVVEESGIKIVDKADYIIPAPQPPAPLDSFIKVDENLMIKDGVYAAGDIVDMGPKLGEMSMKMGIHVANSINVGRPLRFEPMFTYIMDTSSGKGIHIKSNLPWRGSYQSVKVSALRLLFKRFIERYYIYRKGNMGFLALL
ncbi:MAG: hypothetical protein QXR69_01665 [Conexivisphaerales archaeon]